MQKAQFRPEQSELINQAALIRDAHAHIIPVTKYIAHKNLLGENSIEAVYTSRAGRALIAREDLQLVLAKINAPV